MLKNNSLQRRLYNKVHTSIAYKHYRKDYLALANEMSRNIPIEDSDFSKSVLKEYSDYWKQLDPNPDPIFFMLYSSLRGELDINYIPDYLYRFPVELMLLNKRYSLYFENKCLYEKRLPEFADLFPRAVLRRIDGCNYDKNFKVIDNIDRFIKNLTADELVLKESIDTGAGAGVFLFSKDERYGIYQNSDNIELGTWLSEHPDAIAQERENQVEFMKNINPTSINTFRIVTYRSVTDNEVHVLQALIKRGKSGSFVDNLNSGGDFIEIKDDNTLSSYGLTNKGEKKPFDLGGLSCPYIQEVKELAMEIAKSDLFHRQLFFDIFIDKNEKVRIMEINYSAHPTIQAVCGPAFKNFTQEVIDYCKSNLGHLVRVIPFTS